MQLDEKVPYVNSLHFGDKKFRINLTAMEECDYSECTRFWLNLKGKMIMENSCENLTFLKKLHKDLECEALEGHFARILREQLAELPVESIEQISDSDSDETILTKVLHEVRLYIHLQSILSENPSMVDAVHNGRVETNINRLRKVHEEVMVFQPTKHQIKYWCERFITDLEVIMRNPPNHLRNQDFNEKFKQLYLETFCNMIIDRNPRAGGFLSLPPEFQVINIDTETAETTL